MYRRSIRFLQAPQKLGYARLENGIPLDCVVANSLVFVTRRGCRDAVALIGPPAGGTNGTKTRVLYDKIISSTPLKAGKVANHSKLPRNGGLRHGLHNRTNLLILLGQRFFSGLSGADERIADSDSGRRRAGVPAEPRRRSISLPATFDRTGKVVRHPTGCGRPKSVPRGTFCRGRKQCLFHAPPAQDSI